MKNIFNRKQVNAVGTAVSIAVALLSLVPLMASGCGDKGGMEGRLKVAADIVPIADFCKEVGGELVEVETMVPPGATPHAYELSTGQMRFLAEADLLVMNGLDLTPWAEGIFSKTGNEKMLTVVAGEAVPESELIEAAGYEGSGREENEHGVYDPHVWLDPNLAVYMVEALRDAFIAADPENENVYRGNGERYIEELERLDSEIERRVASFTERGFVAFHPSWTYFARRYGLEQVGVIEELPGKEPSAGEIAALVELIEAQGVGVVFAEPQFNAATAEAIAEESAGDVIVRVLDPLGNPEDPAGATYVKTMMKNLEVMEEVLR
jgi:zinc transport system substrate-binding protein